MSKERVVKLRYDPKGSMIACQSADNTIALFTIRSEDEISSLRKKKAKKAKKKQKEGHGNLSPLPF